MFQNIANHVNHDSNHHESKLETPNTKHEILKMKKKEKISGGLDVRVLAVFI